MKDIINTFLFVLGGTIFVMTCTGILFGLAFLIGSYFGIIGVGLAALVVSILFLKSMSL